MDLLEHYRKLVFYNFNRFKGNNCQLLREYLAQILISEVEEFMPLWNKRVLDVGGARGEFCKVLNRKRKCRAINLEPRVEKNAWPETKKGVAEDIPFKDNQFDLVICRGVLEHIAKEKQQQSMNEMYRVTRAGGIAYVLIPPWYNPHAGHSLKPFHILPFKLAKFLREIIFRKKIRANSLSEAGLYPITFKEMLKMISASRFRVAGTKDTHFRMHFLTRIPIIREIAVPAVAFICRK